MNSIILAHHSDDEELASSIDAKLSDKGYKVHRDINPFEGNQWDGGWDAISAIASTAVVLVTKNLAGHIDATDSKEEPYTLLTKITYSNPDMNMIPIIVENVELPRIFIGVAAINSAGQSHEKISENIDDYIDFLEYRRSSSFKRHLLLISIVLLLLSLGLYLVNLSPPVSIPLNIPKLISPVMMMSFGALGAVSYILFNALGLVNEVRFTTRAKTENHLRIILGAIMGFAAYAVTEGVVPGAGAGPVPLSAATLFSNATPVATSGETKLGLIIIVSFLSGFSSRLVIGLINRGIQLVEKAAGIGVADSTPATVSSTVESKK